MHQILTFDLVSVLGNFRMTCLIADSRVLSDKNAGLDLESLQACLYQSIFIRLCLYQSILIRLCLYQSSFILLDQVCIKVYSLDQVCIKIHPLVKDPSLSFDYCHLPS